MFFSRYLCPLLFLITVAFGCAEERVPINRVQANALAKAFFVGKLDDASDDPEFYMRTTIVDAAAGAGADGLFTSSDAQPTVRVRWEITEKLLIARLTYELVDNTDSKGARRTPNGQVVAAYEIEDHFDIRRAYNEATGEESNVVEENDSDRRWSDRSYFRVNWSKNLITDAYELDTLSQLGMYYAVKSDAIAYYVSDPESPDAPVFDPERGYFDVTNKAFAAPEILTDEWGDFPACWLYGSWPTLNCNPSEVTLRQSYLRVVDRDYEPLDYDGTRMDLFGYFTVNRLGYDRRYGVVDDKWHRFAARWNLYERSHVEPLTTCNTPKTTPIGADPHRDDDGNGTEDECESVGRGSRCDEFRGECTLPMRDRKVRTIAWHVNPGFPEELFEGSAEALDGWNEAVRVAVVASRLAECRRTKGSDCESQMGWPARWSDDFSPPVGDESPAEVPEIFVLCHNPVRDGDAGACGKAGTRPRLGDLRYNFFNILPEYQEMAPWGIMVDAEDPLTGEKIAGSVNQWGFVLDRAASTLVDLLGLLNGTIDPESYIAGQNVADWVKANQPGGGAERGKPMSATETAARKNAFDPNVVATYLGGLQGASGKPGAHPAIRHKARVEALVDAGRLGPGNAELSARLNKLRGTPTEAMLVSPELVQAAGYDPTGAISSDAIRRGSPFGRMNPSVRRSEQRNARVARAHRHSCRVESPEPDTLSGLARVAATLFPPPDPSDKAAVNAHNKEVLLWARQQYSKGVMAHELGHSMGLRHNFAASFDSLNYRAQYWQLRTSNGTITQDCAEGTTNGADCIAPRWRDPISEDEISGNIGRYSTTSVMDYPGDQNQDMLLQGKYDRAAVRFGYGGVVDVWAQDGLSVEGTGEEKARAYKLTAFTSGAGLFGVYYFPAVSTTAPYTFIHYSQYNNEFGLIGDCAPSDAPDAVLGKTCALPAMDVVDYRDMKDFASDPEYAKFSWARNARAVDPTGRVRRGYLFSSDEYADAGNVPSFTNDAGADAYEIVRFLEGNYENRYILDGFRRNRVQFTSWDVTERIQYRYLDSIQQIAKTFAFGALLDGDPTQPTAEFLQDGYYGPLAISGTIALDLFARILTRPEPGYYCIAGACGGAQPYGVDQDMFVADWAPLPELYTYDYRVALGDGRYLHNDFDYSKGYWWGDYQTQVGSYYEKIWATYYLAEAFDYFISNSKEDFTDSRYKNVNFATVFPEQVRRLYGSLMTGDLDTFAPWVVVPTGGDQTPDGVLTYPAWYDPTSIGTRPASALIADPNYAWNEQIYAMVWGAMYFPTNWSQSWLHDARITVLASDQPSWPPAETYAFYHPASGMTYRAHTIGTELVLGQTRQKGVGARMLEWANRLVPLAYLVEVDAKGEPVTNADGSVVLALDASGKPQKNPANPGAAAVLQKYVDNIDVFRQLTATFAYSLTDDDLPQP